MMQRITYTCDGCGAKVAYHWAPGTVPLAPEGWKTLVYHDFCKPCVERATDAVWREFWPATAPKRGGVDG